MRAAAAALVVLHALCTSTARAESLGGAIAGTFWGESPEALQRHFGARGIALPRPLDLGDSYAPLIVRVSPPAADNGACPPRPTVPAHSPL